MMGDHRHRLEHGKRQADIIKNFFFPFFLFFLLKHTMRVIKCCNRLPKDFVESPSLDVFKTQLENSLSNLLYVTGLGWMAFGDPPKLNYSMI